MKKYYLIFVLIFLGFYTNLFAIEENIPAKTPASGSNYAVNLNGGYYPQAGFYVFSELVITRWLPIEMRLGGRWFTDKQIAYEDGYYFGFSRKFDLDEEKTIKLRGDLFIDTIGFRSGLQGNIIRSALHLSKQIDKITLFTGLRFPIHHWMSDSKYVLTGDLTRYLGYVGIIYQFNEVFGFYSACYKEQIFTGITIGMIPFVVNLGGNQKNKIYIGAPYCGY